METCACCGAVIALGQLAGLCVPCLTRALQWAARETKPWTCGSCGRECAHDEPGTISIGAGLGSKPRCQQCTMSGAPFVYLKPVQ